MKKLFKDDVSVDNADILSEKSSIRFQEFGLLYEITTVAVPETCVLY